MKAASRGAPHWESGCTDVVQAASTYSAQGSSRGKACTSRDWGEQGAWYHIPVCSLGTLLGSP